MEGSDRNVLDCFAKSGRIATWQATQTCQRSCDHSDSKLRASTDPSSILPSLPHNHPCSIQACCILQVSSTAEGFLHQMWQQFPYHGSSTRHVRRSTPWRAANFIGSTKRTRLNDALTLQLMPSLASHPQADLPLFNTPSHWFRDFRGW
jgi:hypothetical protein